MDEHELMSFQISMRQNPPFTILVIYNLLAVFISLCIIFPEILAQLTTIK